MPEIEKEEEKEEDEEMKDGTTTVETQEGGCFDIVKHKMKRFPGIAAAGLRIRAEPSYLVKEGGREEREE